MTMYSSSRNARRSGSFGDELNAAIRENPVAAGLVGAGVLWMLFGGRLGSGLPGAARTVTNAVGSAASATGHAVGSAASATGHAVGEAISGAASRVGDAARQVGGVLSSGAGSAAAAVRDAASAGHGAMHSNGQHGSGQHGSGKGMRAAKNAGQVSSDFGHDIAASVQQNLTALQNSLTEALRRQPLVLGAIGLAIGAGIASAFPATKMEQELMGEAGAAVKDRIQEFATETSEFASRRAQEVLDTVKQEAAAHGLTPASATESLKSVAEKVKSAATTSRDAMKDRLS